MIRVAAGLLILLVTMWVRFTNPHATETELFIAYWPLWVGLGIAAIIAIWSRP